MPELPEVETIRRGLNRFILNKKIVNVKVLCDKSFIGPKELIEGQEIIAIRRFGKALVFDFKNQVSMLVHLRIFLVTYQINRLGYFSRLNQELCILMIKENLVFVK